MILVTGASGYIGSHLCQYFASKGTSVTGVLGPSGRRPSWISETSFTRFEQIDLLETNAVQSLFERVNPQFVINCAAYGAKQNSTDEAKLYSTNVDLVRRLLQACVGRQNFRGFVQSSAALEYGSDNAGRSEDSPACPMNHYAMSKAMATELVKFYGRVFDVPSAALRICTVYGPGEDSVRLVPRLLAGARSGNWPQLSQPDIARDFVHIDDILRAFECALKKMGEFPNGSVFNIGSSQSTTIGELVSKIRSHFPETHPPEWGKVPRHKWDPTNFYADISKTCRLLGWAPQVGLEQGIDWLVHGNQGKPAAT